MCVVYIIHNNAYFTGVEKNDDSKRHYFFSNKHDAPGEIIRSADRRHYGRVCGITQIVCVKGGVILNKMKSTGRRWYSRGQKTSQRRQHNLNTLMSFPILHLYFLHSLTNQLFSKLPHSQKVPLCAHPSCCSVCVCVCVSVSVYTCVCVLSNWCMHINCKKYATHTCTLRFSHQS